MKPQHKLKQETHCACGQRLIPGHHHIYGLWGMWCLKRGDCELIKGTPGK
jgi:hypothetical protein